MRETIALAISEQSQVGEARRVAIALAVRLGFNEAERGKVGIVVTELANNLVRYAEDGMLLLQEIQQQEVLGLEILSLDKGPGIDDLDRCLRDGYSTGGTPGNGMGAIQRLSEFFEIHSILGVGTAIVVHLWPGQISAPFQPDKLELGTICLPKLGEEVSGDAWARGVSEQCYLVLVADGLGHGPQAAQASRAAVQIFEDHIDQSPKAILEAAHQALRSTRGAALAIAKIDFTTQSVCFAGVGNIAGSLLSLDSHTNLVSLNGTVGYTVRKVQEFNYQWPVSGLLVMYSDGLSTQWHLDRYPGLSHKHPSLVAGVLYRDFNRGRDDVTVLVAREAH